MSSFNESAMPLNQGSSVSPVGIDCELDVSSSRSHLKVLTWASSMLSKRLSIPSNLRASSVLFCKTLENARSDRSRTVRASS